MQWIVPWSPSLCGGEREGEREGGREGGRGGREGGREGKVCVCEWVDV